ncbi:MAG: hypothetical protein KME01_02580 [Chroococcus sp. CMT-3BRIN-NPC107]|jgi:hypothetical protein|nr:hypothetical protein [Chroococcus sp. CMT-3BRIN-NPC107]
MSKFEAATTQTASSLSSIEPLQPPLSREKPQIVINGWQKLLANAEKVNQLSEQLEAALFELKVTASEIKGDQNAYPISNKIFNHKFLAIPCIRYKRPGLIVVTTRKIDLFQQEREALQVAQMLRRRTRRRLKRPLSSKLSTSSSSKFRREDKNFIYHLVSTWQKLKIALGQKPTTQSRAAKVNKAISC